jgi:hypothetical protein
LLVSISGGSGSGSTVDSGSVFEQAIRLIASTQEAKKIFLSIIVLN